MKTGRKFNVKRLILVIACVAVLGGSIAGTLAWLTANDAVNNQFTPGVVGCLVSEKTENGVKSDIKVINQGANVSAYMRVELVAVWRDAVGNILPYEAALPNNELANGWFEKGGYYYYPSAVPAFKAGSTTEHGETLPLFSTPVAAPNAPVEGAVYELQILAQSIQAEGTDAAKVWGVTVNTDGTLSIS